MKSNRHIKILELINTSEVETQDDLQHLLNDCGFAVTQATVSRDIKELKMLKVALPDGRYKYTAGGKAVEPGLSPRFMAICAEAVLSVEPSLNLLVVKCLSGTANAVCAALDSLGIADVLGTIAGDDTIFVALRSVESASSLADKLTGILKK